MNTHSVLSSPMIQVKKAAVLGAGTMGAQIAAHLANAGVPTLLLDIVPNSETRPSGRVPVEGSQDRNAIARAGLEAAKKAKPAAFFTADRAALVSIGNFEDDLARLKDCDLIIEAVVENRSEEHTSELQSPDHLVCRLLLEKKKLLSNGRNLAHGHATIAGPDDLEAATRAAALPMNWQLPLAKAHLPKERLVGGATLPQHSA